MASTMKKMFRSNKKCKSYDSVGEKGPSGDDNLEVAGVVVKSTASTSTIKATKGSRKPITKALSRSLKSLFTSKRSNTTKTPLEQLLEQAPKSVPENSHRSADNPAWDHASVTDTSMSMTPPRGQDKNRLVLEENHEEEVVNAKTRTTTTVLEPPSQLAQEVEENIEAVIDEYVAQVTPAKTEEALLKTEETEVEKDEDAIPDIVIEEKFEVNFEATFEESAEAINDPSAGAGNAATIEEPTAETVVSVAEKGTDEATEDTTADVAEERETEVAGSDDIQSATEEVEKPSKEVERPSEQFERPSEEMEGPSEEMVRPSEEMEGPSEEMEGLSEAMEGPSKEMEGPSQEMESLPESAEKVEFEVEDEGVEAGEATVGELEDEPGNGEDEPENDAVEETEAELIEGGREVTIAVLEVVEEAPEPPSVPPNDDLLQLLDEAEIVTESDSEAGIEAEERHIQLGGNQSVLEVIEEEEEELIKVMESGDRKVSDCEPKIEKAMESETASASASEATRESAATASKARDSSTSAKAQATNTSKTSSTTRSIVFVPLAVVVAVMIAIFLYSKMGELTSGPTQSPSVDRTGLHARIQPFGKVEEASQEEVVRDSPFSLQGSCKGVYCGFY